MLSATTIIPGATTSRSNPSSSSSRSNVIRSWPVAASMPTVASKSPSRTIPAALKRERRDNAIARARMQIFSAANSGGPKRSNNCQPSCQEMSIRAATQSVISTMPRRVHVGDRRRGNRNPRAKSRTAVKTRRARDHARVEFRIELIPVHEWQFARVPDCDRGCDQQNDPEHDIGCARRAAVAQPGMPRVDTGVGHSAGDHERSAAPAETGACLETLRSSVAQLPPLAQPLSTTT